MFKLLERQQRRRDGEALIVGGRSFHALAAATGKARSPSVVRRVDGTTSDTALAERWWRRPSTSAHGVDCQQGTTVLCREGSEMPEHTAGIEFSPELAISGVHGVTG